MSEAKHIAFISESEYLADEVGSEVKHEYVAGTLFAMAGGSNRHNWIVTRLTAALSLKCAGSPCEPYNSDTKIRIQYENHTRFYYPDVSVVCHSNPDTDPFQDEPVVIVEVLSASTRRTDQTEKKEAYLTIASLDSYVLLDQDHERAIVYQRSAEGFEAHVVEGPEATLNLSGIQVRLPLAELYA